MATTERTRIDLRVSAEKRAQIAARADENGPRGLSAYILECCDAAEARAKKRDARRANSGKRTGRQKTD